MLSKPVRPDSDQGAMARVPDINESGGGLELRALSHLADVRPKMAGRPLIVGPYDQPENGLTVPTFRTIGRRKVGRTLVPMHVRSSPFSGTSVGPTKTPSATSPTTSGLSLSACGFPRRTSPMPLGEVSSSDTGPRILT